MEPPTPSQTVGPFFHIGLTWPGGERLIDPGDPRALRLGGTVFDGAGEPVPDALVELWQPVEGLFGRCPTDPEGHYGFVCTRPAAVDGQAPHFALSVFARGLLKRVVTRAYLPGEDDAVLGLVDPVRRATLIAAPEGDDLRFDIRLQGEDETVFFDV